jgi:hypothetical protein
VTRGGQLAIRGFQVQTLIALLEALGEEGLWTSVTLEPNVDSEKVDILSQQARKDVERSRRPFGLDG